MTPTADLALECLAALPPDQAAQLIEMHLEARPDMSGADKETLGNRIARAGHMEGRNE